MGSALISATNRHLHEYRLSPAGALRSSAPQVGAAYEQQRVRSQRQRFRFLRLQQAQQLYSPAVLDENRRMMDGLRRELISPAAAATVFTSVPSTVAWPAAGGVGWVDRNGSPGKRGRGRGAVRVSHEAAAVAAEAAGGGGHVGAVSAWGEAGALPVVPGTAPTLTTPRVGLQVKLQQQHAAGGPGRGVPAATSAARDAAGEVPRAWAGSDDDAVGVATAALAAPVATAPAAGGRGSGGGPMGLASLGRMVDGRFVPPLPLAHA